MKPIAMSDHLGDDVRAATRSQIRLVRVLVIWVAISFVTGTVAVVQNFGDVRHNRDRITDIENSRVERNRAICISTNQIIEASRTAQVQGLVTLLGLVRGSEAQKQRLIAAYTATTNSRLPFRDCSDAGIEAYIANPPPDPARHP